MASQTNRLVLVHFWAEWCKPCAQMDRDVFSQQEVVTAIESGFVPVKVNVDHFPAKVRQYGVSIVPTDVVLTPDGQLVGKIVGSLDASQYVARLNQVANSPGGQTGSGYGGQTAGQPAPPAYNQAAAPAYNQPARDAYNSQGPPASQQPFAGSTSQSPSYQPPATGSYQPAPNRYGGQTAGETSPAGPAGYADRNPDPSTADRSSHGPLQTTTPSPAYGASPSAPGRDSASRYQPAVSGYQGAGTAQGDTRPGAPYEPETPYGMNSTTREPSGTTPRYGYGNRPATPEESGPSPYAPDTGGERPWQASGAAGTPHSEQAPPRSEPSLADRLPPGSPPLALDGFCPVRLSEEERWVQGDVRWGARHEGRTYLFSGSAEQQRFLDTPEKYAPVNSGNDVVLAVQQGRDVPGRREHGVWFGGKIYLFSSEASVEQFRANPEQYAVSLDQRGAGTARRPTGPPPGGAARQTMAPPSGRRY